MARIAVIGYGMWGRNWARVLHELGALAMICDPSPAAQRLAQAQFFGVPVYNSHLAALDKATLDGVVLATPSASHAPLADLFLSFGLDVMVEKPMTMSAKEAEVLVELARIRGRILMTGHIMLYHPAYVEMKRQIQAGTIGEVTGIHTWRLNPPRAHRPVGETVLWSYGPHDLSMVYDLVPPSDVIMMPEIRRPIGWPDVCNLSTVQWFGETTHHFSWIAPYKEVLCTVFGTCGVLTYNGVSVANTLSLYRDETRAYTLLPFFQDEPLKLEALDFLRCLKTRCQPRSSGAKALPVIRLLDEAHKEENKEIEEYGRMPNLSR